MGPGPLDGPPLAYGAAPIQFHDPFPHDQNVQYAQPRRQSPPRRYDDDAGLGPRISTLEIEDDPRERIQKRNGSNARRQSILVRRVPSSTPTFSKSYQLHRLEKTGEDWNVANIFNVPAPDKEIQGKIKKGQKNGSVADQLANMRPARREQVLKLTEELNNREIEPGVSWKPISIENKEVIRTSRNTQDIRAMEVVFQRSSPSRRPSQGKSFSESYLTRRSDLREENKFKDKDKKGGKDKDGDGKAKVKDIDPFQSSPLFSNDGTPMNDQGPIHFEDAGLPPFLPKEEPIGRPLSMPPRSRSRSRNPARTSGEIHGEAGANPHGIEEIPPPPPGRPGENLSMEEALYGHEGGSGADDHDRGRRRRDSTVDVRPLPIQPRGSLSRQRSTRRRDTRSRSRPRSKSRPKAIRINSRQADHSDHYFHGNSSVSSNEDIRSILRGEVDELSTNTSGSIHNDSPPEHGFARRRYSSKHDRPREHYPGPTYPPSPTKFPRSEQILVSDRRPPLVRGQRPMSVSFIPQTQMPLRVVVGGRTDRSPDRYPPRPTSPRRGGRELEVYNPTYPAYPTEFERDRAREMGVDSYMADTRREQELREREYRVSMAEREIEDRERRRSRGYFAPGGYSVGSYGDRGYFSGGYGEYRR
jgi:hypothetical protein